MSNIMHPPDPPEDPRDEDDFLTAQQRSELRPVVDIENGILFKPHEDNQLKFDKRGKFTLEYFPEGFIALQRELASGLHPTLVKTLSNHPQDEIDIILAEIATYCQVALDGTYTLEERSNLCAILAGRLEVLRELPRDDGQKILLS